MDVDSFSFTAPLRPARLSDQIYARIFGLIVEGEFPEDSKLPTEVEFAERFVVSRTIVREALARLRDDGVVISRQGAGSFVKRRPDGTLLSFAPVGSIADIQRCFEFRIALEGEAAATAAMRADSEGLSRIDKAFDALEEIVQSGALGTDADYEFHLAIAEATQNRFFASVIGSLKGHVAFGINLARSLSLIRPSTRIKAVQAEHRAIFEAIRTGDAQAARDAMRTHIDNARKRMFEGSDPAPKPAPP